MTYPITPLPDDGAGQFIGLNRSITGPRLIMMRCDCKVCTRIRAERRNEGVSK